MGLALRTTPLIGLAVLGLAACTHLPPEAKVSVTKPATEVESTAAGTNQVGESCRSEPAQNALGSGLAQGFNVFCGTWQQPSGRVFRAAAGASDLAQLAQSSPWRAALNERMSCADPVASTILGNAPAQLMQCTRRNGGWPHIAFVANVSGQIYFVDGVPSAEPAMETVVAAAAGRAAPAANAASAPELTAIIAAHPFGSGDISAYEELTHLGEKANDAGDYAAAEQAYRNALALKGRLQPNEPFVAEPMMNLALQISNQGRFVEAEELFARAGKLVEELGDPLMQAQFDLYLATHAVNRERLDEAASRRAIAESEFSDAVPQSFIEAAQGHPQSKTGNNLGDSLLLGPRGEEAVRGLAESWSLKAKIEYLNGDYPQAKVQLAQVRDLLRASGVNPPGVVPRVVRLAALSDARLGNFTGAAAELGTAADLFSAYGAKDRPMALTLFFAGRTALAAGNNALALNLFRQGAKIARERHFGLPESIVSEYLRALDAAAHAPGTDDPKLAGEFFEATQLIQGNVTGQVVAQATARLSANNAGARDLLRDMQDADLKLQQLYAERDQVAQLPIEQDTSDALAKVDAEIAEIQDKRAAADSAAQAASPEYARLVSTNAPTEAIQHLLRPREGLITFVVGAKASFAVLVDGSGVVEYPIELAAAQATQTVAALRKTIELQHENGKTKLPDFDVGAAYQLYRTLFGSVEAKLAKLDRLVVVPNGALSSVPLEVLVTQKTAAVTDGNYKDVPFLLNKLAISYVPAAQTLAILRANAKPSAGAKPYIGFGDFRPASPQQLAATFPPDRCAADYKGLSGLPTLPGTRKEISTIGGSILHAAAEDIVLGGDFTKAKLTGMDLTQFRIVHLATHAFLPTELHCRTEPLIALSVPPDALDANAGFLGLSDVLALKLDADLVLLSACNTAGPGGGGAGDSLSGLTKAFFFAGARGLLVTHWALDDTAGPLLTALALTPGSGTRDSALDLQQAKLNMIHKVGARTGGDYSFFTHPYAWAPFVLVGDGFRAAPPPPSS